MSKKLISVVVEATLRNMHLSFQKVNANCALSHSNKFQTINRQKVQDVIKFWVVLKGKLWKSKEDAKRQLARWLLLLLFL